MKKSRKLAWVVLGVVVPTLSSCVHSLSRSALEAEVRRSIQDCQYPMQPYRLYYAGSRTGWHYFHGERVFAFDSRYRVADTDVVIEERFEKPIWQNQWVPVDRLQAFSQLRNKRHPIPGP